VVGTCAEPDYAARTPAPLKVLKVNPLNGVGDRFTHQLRIRSELISKCIKGRISNASLTVLGLKP